MTDTTKTDTMTIREMCDAFGVTPRTLRFYEQKELIFPIREGTRRHFTRRDRVRLKLILRAKRFGFGLEEVRQLLDMYDEDRSGVAQYLRSYELAEERLTQMQAQRHDLEEAITELQTILKDGAPLRDSYRRRMTEKAA